ncbi:hypothetical protein BC832DRAFT_560682 [Gaertneriomyces semiglobifer]|nr:hypothetical protein BC832DRAFT_560682 [Gaertneriomyces semiglobifer]
MSGTYLRITTTPSRPGSLPGYDGDSRVEWSIGADALTFGEALRKTRDALRVLRAFWEEAAPPGFRFMEFAKTVLDKGMTKASSIGDESADEDETEEPPSQDVPPKSSADHEIDYIDRLAKILNQRPNVLPAFLSDLRDWDSFRLLLRRHGATTLFQDSASPVATLLQSANQEAPGTPTRNNSPERDTVESQALESVQTPVSDTATAVLLNALATRERQWQEERMSLHQALWAAGEQVRTLVETLTETLDKVAASSASPDAAATPTTTSTVINPTTGSNDGSGSPIVDRQLRSVRFTQPVLEREALRESFAQWGVSAEEILKVVRNAQSSEALQIISDDNDTEDDNADDNEDTEDEDAGHSLTLLGIPASAVLSASGSDDDHSTDTEIEDAESKGLLSKLEELQSLAAETNEATASENVKATKAAAGRIALDIDTNRRIVKVAPPSEFLLNGKSADVDSGAILLASGRGNKRSSKDMHGSPPSVTDAVNALSLRPELTEAPGSHTPTTASNMNESGVLLLASGRRKRFSDEPPEKRSAESPAKVVSVVNLNVDVEGAKVEKFDTVEQAQATVSTPVAEGPSSVTNFTAVETGSTSTVSTSPAPPTGLNGDETPSAQSPSSGTTTPVETVMSESQSPSTPTLSRRVTPHTGTVTLASAPRKPSVLKRVWKRVSSDMLLRGKKKRQSWG